MANVISQMLEHLGSVQAGKTSADLLKEASEVENQDERLVFIQTLFENFHLNQPTPLESKDSQLFFERGYFHQAKSAMEFGDLEYALKRLNEGLTLIPKAECQLLSSAYSLRAEILLRGRHFEAAALDVANATFGAEKVAGWDARLNKVLALSNKLSKISEDDSKRKQEIESGDFGKALETFVTADQNLEETRSEKVPALQVEVPNPLVPCASEALTLSPTGNGIHFVATRDIKPGEILMVEEPLVFKADHTQYDRCSHCFKTVVATLPCSGCCWQTYCGELCKEEAQPVHEKECRLNAKLIYCAGDEDVLQLLIKLILSKGGAAFCGAKRDKELCSAKALTSDNINSLFLVQPEAQDSVLGPALCRALAKFLGLGGDQQLDELVSAMSRLLPYVAAATSCIEEVVPGGGFTGSDTFGKIGAAVYPVRALVALSCSPNAIAFNVGIKSVVQATRLIPEGCEVTQCANPRHDFLRVARPLRHSFLQRECGCEACASDWPTLDKLPTGDDDLEALVLAQDRLTPHLMPFALEAAEELERRNSQHTRVFHQLQERIRLGLAMQGNVLQL